MTTAIRGFKMEMEEASTVVDVYSALAANTAVSQQELAEAMTRTASSMESVGSSFQDTSAMIATMVAVTRESANNIGSAMKSIASRYGELTKDPTALFDSEGEAMSFNKVDAALKSVGISMQTVDHQFRSFTDVIIELGEKWDQLDSTQQRYIATQFAGNRQQSRFLALISNVDQLKANMDVAANSEDVGTLQALKTLDSLETKINQVQVAYQQFYTTIGIESVWKGALDGIKNYINTLNELPKMFGKIPVAAIAMVGNLVGLIKNVLFKGLSLISKGWLDITKTGTQQADTSAKQGGQQIGNSWIDSLLKALRGRKGEVQAEMQDVVQSSSNSVIQSQAQKNQTGNIMNLLSAQANKAKLEPDEMEGWENWSGSDSNYTALFKSQIGQLNAILPADQATQSIIDTWNKAGITSENYARAIDEVSAAYQHQASIAPQVEGAVAQVENATLSAGQKIKNFGKSIFDAGSKSSQVIGGIGQALGAFAPMLNNGSRATEKLSGGLTALGGAFMAARAAALAFESSNPLGWIMLGINAIITFSSGISTWYESSEERLERLNKEAEELSNKAKEEKANYNILQRSVDKYEELKEKRYESAEAEEEFIEASNELADKFPQLIVGFDEAGNAIIEVSDSESILTEARLNSAKATYEAAQAQKEANDEILKENKKTALNKGNAFLSSVRNKISPNNITSGLINPEEWLSSKAVKRENESDEDWVNNVLDSIIDFYIGDVTINGSLRNAEELKNLVRENKFFNGKDFSASLFNNFIEDNELGYIFGAASRYLETYYTGQNKEIPTFDNEIANLLEAYDNEVIETGDEAKALVNLKNRIVELGEKYPAYKGRIAEIFASDDGEYGDFLEAIRVLDSSTKTQKSLSKKEISSWLELEEVNSDIYDFINNSSGLVNFATSHLYDLYEESNISDWNDYAVANYYGIQGYLKELDEFYSTILSDDEEKAKLFEKMFSETDKYSSEDIFTEFNIDKNSGLGESIISYYTDIKEQIQESMINRMNHSNISTDSDFYKNIINSSDFTKNEYNYLRAILDASDNAIKRGFSNNSELIQKYGIEIYEIIDQIDEKNPQLAAAILDSISKYGLSTISDIDFIIEELSNNETLKVDYSEFQTELIANLGEIRKNIIKNFSIAIQTDLSAISEAWESDKSDIKKLTTGLTTQEAIDFINKASALGLEILPDDFISNGENLILSTEKFNEYWKLYSEKLSGSAEDYQDFARKWAGLLNEDHTLDMDAIGALVDENKGFFRLILNELGFNPGNNDIFNYISDNQSEINKSLQEYYSNLELYNWTLERAENELRQGNFSKGDYSSLNIRQSFENLERLGSIDTKLGKEDYDLRTAQESLRNGYSSLISDVLSKGFENINLDDYEGLVNTNLINAEMNVKSYEEFVSKYAQIAGYSIEETNDLIIQAIQKDQQASVGIVSSFKDITFTENAAYASLDTLNAIANAFGMKVTDLFDPESYNSAFEGYAIDWSKVDPALLNDVEGLKDIVNDGMREYIDSVAKLITSGISGSLTGAEATILQGQLDAIGLGSVQLDFTQTAEGLQLSRDSAIELYQALKGVDGIAGQLVFDGLVQNLEKAGNGYENISQTTANIVKLEQEIATLSAKIGHQQSRGFDTKSDDEKLQKLRNELSLAKEIQRVQSQDASSYDFMGHSLPDYLQGPENYWNSVGTAFKVMNEAKNNQYMEIQDFYNIVNEMSNLAVMSGQDLIFMGETLYKDGTGAAELITLGLNALSNVDGEGVKIDFSRLSDSMIAGAESMGDGFDTAVQAMARSQVEMLDGMIAILETVVAMEELGKIDVEGDGIDVGDIFKINHGRTTGFTDAYKDAVDFIRESEKMAPLLDQVRINGITLNDLLTSDYQAWKELGIGQQEFANIIKSIYEASISDNYDLDNLLQSIGQEISATGQVFSYYDKEANKQYVIDYSGRNYTIDYSDEKEIKKVKDAFEKAGIPTDDESIRDFFERASRGEFESSSEKLAYMESLGEVSIGTSTDINSGENTYNYQGKTYTNETDVLRAIAFGEEEKRGAMAVETDIGTGTGTFKTVAGFTYDIEVDAEGNVSYTSSKVEGTFNSWSDFVDQAILQYSKKDSLEEITNEERIAIIAELGIDINPNIRMNPAFFQTLDKDIQEEVKEKLRSGNQQEIDLVLSAHPEWQLPEGTTAEQFMAATGLDFKTLDLTLQLSPTTDERLAELITSPDTIELKANLSINIGKDETGLFSSKDEEVPITPTVTNTSIFSGGITEAMKEALPTVEAAGTEAGNAVGDSLSTAMESKADDVISVAQTIAQGIIDAFSPLEDKLKSIWEYFEKIANQPITFTPTEGSDVSQDTTITNTLVIDTATAQTALELLGLAAQAAADELSKTTKALKEIVEAAKKFPSRAPGLVEGLASAMDNIPSGKGNYVANLASAMLRIPDVASRINTLITSLNRIPSSKNIDITATVDVKTDNVQARVKGQIPSKGTKVRITHPTASPLEATAMATGNAMAGGRTLMGELGPELVVSGGRYYIVGTNGAEFVDLAPDAIVFNHLQTEDLLKKGRSSHGSPVTNERTAVSFATGNAGPAMASASQALAALKQIRAMWQSMLDADAKQLGSMAGRGGSGGGSSGGGGNDAFQEKNVIADIERWYNLLRQIEKIEEQISYQESLQSKIESDRLANGRALYISYKKELDLLDEEIKRNKQLAELQKSWYDNKRKELEASSYGLIFTYDEEGLMQYVSDAPGSGRGLDILENLTRRDVTGQAIGHARTAATQLDYLKSLGFDLKDLLYNDDGTLVAKYNSAGQLVSAETDEVLTDEELANAQTQMMENFWSNVDGWRDELDSLYDSYHEQQEKIIENQTKQNEILQKLIDNQISVENDILKAIEAREQAEIDRLQAERDALEEATDKFLNGLEEQLNREKDMYQKNQNAEELTKLQRQLAILQRSGGSASQIRSLQDQIDSKQQQAYFDKQQEQIDAIKEASDKQIEKLDNQIDLMTETLEYQKDNGLLWREVREIMMKTPEEVMSLLQQWDPDYRSKSELQISEDLRDFKLRFETWVGERDQEKLDTAFKSVTDSASTKFKNAGFTLGDDVQKKAREAFNSTWAETGDIDKANAAAQAVYDSAYSSAQAKKQQSTAPSPAPAQTPAQNNQNADYWGEGTIKNGYQYYTYDSASSTKKGPILADDGKGASYKIIQVSGSRAQIDEVYDNGKRAPQFDKRWMTYNSKYHTFKKYKDGGSIDYTGWAWVDGTPGSPETVLSAKHTDYLKNELIGNVDSLKILLADFESAMRGTANANTYNSIERTDSVIIENASVNMNVGSISNDYDARRAGAVALDEMVRIARKTGNRSLSRR